MPGRGKADVTVLEFRKAEQLQSFRDGEQVVDLKLQFPPDVRKEKRDAMRAHWKNMSPEERQEIRVKMQQR